MAQNINTHTDSCYPQLLNAQSAKASIVHPTAFEYYVYYAVLEQSSLGVKDASCLYVMYQTLSPRVRVRVWLARLAITLV